MLSEFLEKHQLSEAFEKNALKRFIPLSEQIVAHHNRANRTLFVAINGCQGSGKSTLGAFLKEYIEATFDLTVAILSLDDFYLSKSDRLALSVKVHPLFETRGVPGTHNVSQLKQVLESLKQSGNCSIPRFDKSNDDPFPKDQWSEVDTPIDIVLMEGWCWGVNHQSASALESPCNSLESQEDASGVWRHFVNQQLKHHYEPLYKMMDYWIMLKAPDFNNVFAWRLEQENKMINAPGTNGNASMDQHQIKHFIQFFQRLTEHALASLPEKCDVVFELDEYRQITQSVSRES